MLFQFINLDTNFDDRRTFLTEFTNEEDDQENNEEEEEKTIPTVSAQQPNSVSEFMNKNYVIKVLEIKTISTSSARRDRAKSGSDQNNYLSKKGNLPAKST
ncbi:hypothetical protein DMUE_6343 [Dictyocoela muelleri]|nr:hypothetical protein DMUE_6343 [Dictyocoela muelleri]